MSNIAKITEKAKSFAITAHIGQIRKSDKEKPKIIHPINVANILQEYNFDDNVIAAGYLHDVIEDTKYTKEDLLKSFGEDVVSLVLGATEEDKSLSWEERKQETITKVKTLDLRHKAVVCADKISNLEDLRIIFEINEKKDFSAFKRGFDKQKWYYTGVYDSLIYNEDEKNDMFVRLKLLIDYIFYDNKHDELEREIFSDNIEEYNKLIKFHYRKQEIYKMKSVLEKNKTYVIEFTGTPRTGKTTLMNNLYDFFKKGGFTTSTLEEFTTSKRYKKDIYPRLKNEYKSVINTEIPKYVLEDLNTEVSKNYDIILVDRSLFDRMIWMDRLYNKNGVTKEEYDNYINEYTPLIKNKINIVLGLYTDSLTSLKRDYYANISLEKRTFLNEKNINEYNNSLMNMKELSSKININFHMFDTTNKNEREISFQVLDVILSDMRKQYIDILNKEFNK
mgnify:CR=1 FL=1